MDARMRESLDRYITGNYGEDQYRGGDEEELVRQHQEPDIRWTRSDSRVVWTCEYCLQYPNPKLPLDGHGDRCPDQPWLDPEED
jgi:hypothetical protein